MFSKTILISLLLFFGYVSADEAKGLAIIKEVDVKDSGWADATAEMSMILSNQQGQTSTRALRLRFLEVPGDGDKSLTIFDSPKDIKGTAFLSHTHALSADDQWLFLPALKRVKRIASANKSGPFVGSEFAYEDLTSFEVEKYKYKWLRNEDVSGIEHFVIEAYPVYEYSGYTKQVLWISSKTYQPSKIEFFDRKSTILKTLISNNMQQYLGQYWRAEKMIMTNHQTGKKTQLNWLNWKFKTGLSSRDFDKTTLKRIR